MTNKPTPNGATKSTPEVMTVLELAVYLQVSRRTVYNMAAAGEIPAARIAGQWRFKKSEIDKWLERLSQQSYKGDEAAPEREEAAE